METEIIKYAVSWYDGNTIDVDSDYREHSENFDNIEEALKQIVYLLDANYYSKIELCKEIYENSPDYSEPKYKGNTHIPLICNVSCVVDNKKINEEWSLE